MEKGMPFVREAAAALFRTLIRPKDQGFVVIGVRGGLGLAAVSLAVAVAGGAVLTGVGQGPGVVGPGRGQPREAR